jgi:hypothetical protein
LLTLGVTAWLELISIWIPSAPGTTVTPWSWLCDEEAEAAAGFVAGFAPGATGLDPGIAAGFTAGAGAPGAGLAAAGTPAGFEAALSCFCCSDFAVLRALSMASAFCATAFVAADPPTTSAIAKMPVVSFIAIPTSPPAFPV